jgi:hypothetical protein
MKVCTGRCGASGSCPSVCGKASLQRGLLALAEVQEVQQHGPKMQHALCPLGVLNSHNRQCRRLTAYCHCAGELRRPYRGGGHLCGVTV